MKMKKASQLFSYFLAVVLAISFTGCNGDGDGDGDGGVVLNGTLVEENITGDVTWESGEIYILGGRITVESGATLTIESGVVVKGKGGTGVNATALLVAKGGTLNAQGTSSAPIIMTSVVDDIEPGDIVSPNNLDPTLNGLWGGLIVLGDASISADDSPFQIEGIPASDPNGLYGGSADDDNSGTIQYVSLRHGGSNIGEGNEINGITLGGVGTGTTIDHIEIVANQDDGIECFGGTVDVSDILVWNSGDDAFDMDQDYQGTISNFIGIMGDETDHAMELDGPEGDADMGGFTLSGGSLKGWNDEGEDGGEFADLRSGCKCVLEDIYFFNFSVGADIELDNDGVAANYAAGDITFSGLEFDFSLSYDDDGTTVVVQTNDDVELADVLLDKGKDEDSAGDAFATTGATPADVASKVTSPTVGATASAFSGWTWAAAAGELSDF